MRRSAPEPARDIAAQLQAVLDPRSAKDAVFIAPGSPEPPSAGLHRIERDDGVLLTSNPVKAKVFDELPELTDETMALLLDYPESKSDVLREGGIPVVVQGVAHGGIAFEAAASERWLQHTIEAARLAVPDGDVRLTTLEDALATRAREYADGGA
jgi:hypothetical protein